MKAIRTWFLLLLIAPLISLPNLNLLPRPVYGAANFSFAVAGDFGGPTDDDRRTLLDKLQNDGIAFLLALGDLGYINDEAAWCSDSKAHFNNIVIIAGNHDTAENGPAQIADFVTSCPFPLGGVTVQYNSIISSGYGYEYYFDYPVVSPLARFILITPNIEGEINYDYSASSPHYNWVTSSVNGARAIGIPWIIVGMHKQCFSMGDNTGCPSSMQHSDHGMHDIVNKLIELKVDLILQAHEHNYQRGKQFAFNSSTCPLSQGVPHQDDAGVPDMDCIVDDGSDNHYTKDQGPVIVITGTGGTNSSPETSCFPPGTPSDVEAPYFVQCMGANSSLKSFGSTRFAVSSSTTAPFIAANFIPNTGGYFADSFVISKNGPLPQVLTLNPTDDAWVELSNPDANHGTETVLRVDLSPKENFLLKFSINGISTGEVVNARIKLTVGGGSTDGSNSGGEFYKTVTDTWSESSVTWNNAPATTGPRRTSVGAVAQNTAYDVDITYGVTGDGTLSPRIIEPTIDDKAVYLSDEATSNRPQLKITYIPGPLTVDFTWTPSVPRPGQVVTFTATTSGGAAPFTFTWDFGDGATGSGNPVTHVYGICGFYDVTVTVTDGFQTATKTKTLQVYRPPPCPVLPSP